MRVAIAVLVALFQPVESQEIPSRDQIELFSGNLDAILAAIFKKDLTTCTEDAFRVCLAEHHSALLFNTPRRMLGHDFTHERHMKFAHSQRRLEDTDVSNLQLLG
jgi:hypothetical protein